MSSCPGHNLEAYLAWCYDLVVEDQAEANFNMHIAERLGRIPARPRISKAQFAEMVELFEPYREEIENKLAWFEEDTQSWRDYSCYAFDFIPDELDKRALEMWVASSPPPA